MTEFNKRASTILPDPSLISENRSCPSCGLSVVNETGGVVVAFGQSFFHVDCFKCAKCGDKVTADTNLLLLSDGSPICANCSYCCNVCKLPILDEAIMTGDDSYHAHCFKCKVCRNRIDELVFAKTSQGIYCMNCHNQRVARSRRRHQEKKAAQAQAQAQGAANGTTGSNGSASPVDRSLSPLDTVNSSQPIPKPGGSRPMGSPSRHRTQSSGAGIPVQDSIVPPLPQSISLQARSLSDSVPPPANTPSSYRPPGETVPLPEDSGRRTNSANANGLGGSLQPPTSRAAKRQSINPAMAFDPSVFMESSQRRSSVTSLNSNRSDSPRYASDSLTRDSPSLQSPFREGFQNDVLPSPYGFPERSGTLPSGFPHSIGPVDSFQRNGRAASTSQSDSPLHSLPSMPSPGALNSMGGFRPLRPQTVTPPSRLIPTEPPSVPLSPTSPNHRVDVPTGIESESDRESDEKAGTIDSPATRSAPPSDDENLLAPPSKGSKGYKRPPNLNIQSPASSTTIAENEPDGSEAVEIEEPSGSEISQESSPVEQTSHSTFIAPALPPIRFSMSGSDFGDFMKLGGQDSQRAAHLKAIALDIPEVVKDSGEELELKASPPRRRRASEADDTPRQVAPAKFEASRSESTMQPSISERTSSDSDQKPPEKQLRERLESNVTVRFAHSGAEAHKVDAARKLRTDTSDLVAKRLQEALDNAADRGAPHMKFDKEFVEAIATMVEQRKEEYLDMKKKLDGLKRASQQYMDGLNVAQSEYDREIRARRDAEAEVTRLRVLLSGQAMKLTVLSGEAKRQDAHVQLTRELSDKMTGLERDLSTLKVERDMTLAEMEELSASKGTGDPSPEETGSKLSRNLTTRLDKIKKQYRRDLLPLTQQRERLEREIDELKAHRDLLLEETTVLNLRNEELAQLTQQYLRRMEAADVSATPVRWEKSSQSLDKPRPPQYCGSASTSTLNDEVESRAIRMGKPDASEPPASSFRPPKFLKWHGKASREHLTKEPAINIVPPEMTPSKPRPFKEHIFQQFSALRFARCDHCGDKMWGGHLRCTGCHMSVHPKCLPHVHTTCAPGGGRNEPASNVGPLPPSMFGRDLIEQVRADSKGEERYIPVIVEKCIDAVDALALDYEGIYRKTGGSGLSKTITQLFERGDYDSFDLRDTDRFNDISSVTSVLKTYFRSLPDPLFTYALHDDFVQASHIRDLAQKSYVLAELVSRLPPEHLYTAKLLMMHLHRVSKQSEVNLMTARNLGVVFGPTLMRSRLSGAEFSDMAEKSLTVEWFIENAPTAFNPALDSSNQ
ncbi:hypothetical protein BJ322DRAFT_995743 [Thelephora terrestris]|uniref:RhoGAP-domain-containing protein n=1 Tax=Thelephora terrestris TaxID=56493 RepID=A0A9P6HRL3_9AGAM|nr:hypothetical protein BJ322DRAFT_995743 [Thelephora terrestris]